MKVQISKLLVAAGFAAIAITASGCGEAKTTPVPPPPPGGNGDGPVSRANQRPNLRVTRFDAQVRASGTVRCVVEVSNTGLASTGRGSTVSVRRIDDNGRPNELGSAQVPVLGAGQSSPPLNIVIPVGKLKVSKSILLCAYADIRQEIKEGTDGEKDNHTDREIVYGPDLIVKGITNPTPDEPSKLSLNARVANIGTISANGVNATWAYQIVDSNQPRNRKEDEKWKVITTQSLGNVVPNAPQLTPAKLDFPAGLQNELAGKTIAVTLFLDRDRKIEELDNTNNNGGVGHTFPPNKPDLNVWGLMSWWNRSEAKLHFHSFITNTGTGAVPGGKFESQWFREPGARTGADTGANATGGSGTNEGWEAMSEVLQHDAAEAQRPWKRDVWAAKNPEFTYVPDVKEEGNVIALRYEVDPYNEIAEETDPAPGTNGQPGSNVTETPAGQPQGGKAKIGEKVRLGRNGPNNSFVWNFQVPKFQQANLRIVSIEPTVSDERDRVNVEVNVGNYGTIGAGKYKIVATLDGQTRTHEIPNMPPGYMNVGWPFRFTLSRAQVRAGVVNLTVRVEPSRKNRTEDALNATRRILVPDGKIGAVVLMSGIEAELQKLRRDPEKPDRYDTLQIRYRVVNRGDQPSGPLRVTAQVEGGPSASLDDKDGIAPNNTYPNVFLLDITKMGNATKKTPIKITMTVDAENDKDKSDNNLVYNEVVLPPTDPAQLLPDLIVSEIRGASKNNNAVGTYRMHCTIANVGQGAAPNFWVKWWVNDKMVTRGVVGALQPKTSTDRFDGNVCEYKLQPKDKKLRVMVIIDPDNQVPQENILNDWANAEFDKDVFYDNPAPLKIDVPDPAKAEKDPDDEDPS